jgi:plastocyanin
VTIKALVTDPAVGAVSFVIAFAPLTMTTTVTQGPAQVGTADIHHTEQWNEKSKTLERQSTAKITSSTIPDTVVSATVTTPATNSSAIPGATHIVQVGIQNQTLFRPNQLDAAVGDIVIFNFHQSNLTVSESTLDEPCIASKDFDTGLHQFITNGARMPLVAFSVENSAPRWFFCQQKMIRSHCNDGMVFGLNPGEKMNDFLQNALNQTDPDTHPCLPDDSASCIEPQINRSVVLNRTQGEGGLGRLPSSPAVVPSRMVSRAGRNYKRGAGSLCVLGAAGIGAL